MRVLSSTLALALIPLSATAQNTKLKLPPPSASPQTPLDQRERAVQLLNRFTFGARPGDVEAVLASGTDHWFDQQLDPASIKDDALNRRLADYPTLAMTPEQALTVYPDRGTVEQVADGKRPYPTDPLLACVYEVQVHKLMDERDQKKQLALARPEPTDAEKAAAKKADQETAARVAGELFSLPKAQRMATLIKMPVEDRIAFANNVAGDQKNLLLADFTPRERETFYGMQGGVGVQYQIGNELAQAKIVRAILTERQVQEVMTDFWFNHFNIYVNKDSDQWYTTSYERDVIRPHALGKFRDLLLATAESPAMMVYLDNWLSIGPESLANGVNPANPKSKKGAKGLNENYGREVMELHTVGVNGGYTQADVTHLSAILTGWSVDRPNQAGPFIFDPKKHEPGTKDWFGYRIDEDGNASRIGPADAKGDSAPAGAAPVVRAAAVPGAVPEAPGLKQGITALNLLAASPKTAHFICYLLAQRFVADDPPAALVDRMAATYMSSDGDIKAILHMLVGSPEFNSHRYFRNKVKTPVEFMASAFRSTATDPQNPGALTNAIRDMGMQLYYALPPTGYYLTADHWMNTSALVGRLNFADQLTHNRFSNQKFDAPRVLAFGLMSQPAAAGSATQVGFGGGSSKPRPMNIADHVATAESPATGADVALHVLEGTLIGGDVSAQTNQLIRKQVTSQAANNPTEKLNLLTALVLGSPEFQLR
ncbi:Protein of unknown function [Granulicella rosea]|uniref:DUF1800 domain-containing protein n=1 Tax=Granulicella rosea TaxID=474952 RepID=A0A239GZG4_9BACT|nr:DUF1800 domain-containing protein [Granulicella rosea]SNS74527.1 Protein of unknown function [Granulicella rosea]